MTSKTETPAVDDRHDAWQCIPRDQWVKRLEQVRELMIRRFAVCGLDITYDDYIATSRPDGMSSIAALVLDQKAGALLLPDLAVTDADVRRNIERLGDPDTDVEVNSNLSDLVYHYAMTAAEAGFLLGLVAGTVIPWSVVTAMEPQHEPKTSEPRKTGGAR